MTKNHEVKELISELEAKGWTKELRTNSWRMIHPSGDFIHLALSPSCHRWGKNVRSDIKRLERKHNMVNALTAGEIRGIVEQVVSKEIQNAFKGLNAVTQHNVEALEALRKEFNAGITLMLEQVTAGKPVKSLHPRGAIRNGVMTLMEDGKFRSGYEIWLTLKDTIPDLKEESINGCCAGLTTDGWLKRIRQGIYQKVESGE